MKRELQLAALLACVLLSGGAFALLQTQGLAFAGEWLFGSCLLGAFVWLQCWRRRELNCAAPGSSSYPTLGWANRITLMRGVLIAACGGFLWPVATGLAIGWICAPLYTTAAILDRVDGFVARRGGRITLLGTELDMVVDALGLLVAPLLAISLGKIHWSYLLVSAAYYLFQLGLYWRRQHGLATYPLHPNNLRRAMAGFQMGFIAVVLWPPFVAPVTVVTGVAFMMPVLIGFGVDWFVVSGRSKPQLSPAAGFFRNLAAFSRTFFQPALRLLLLVALFMFSQNSGLGTTTQDAGFWSATVLNTATVANSVTVLNSATVPNAATVLNAYTAMTYTLGICTAMIVLGLGGRIGALILLCLLAWRFPSASLNVAMLAVIVSAVWILLLGCGRFSLWQDDDRWVNRYDGS